MLKRFEKASHGKGAFADRATAMALRREPCENEPRCSSCAAFDEIDAEAVCWDFAEAVTGSPVACAAARALGGPCGPFGNAWRLGKGDVVFAAGPACVDCQHHAIDRGISSRIHDVHLCRRFTDSAGRAGPCHALRGDGGACGPAAAGFDAKLTADDFLIGAGAR